MVTTTPGVFAFDSDTAGSVETSLGTLITDLQSSLDDLSGFVAFVKSQWEGDEQVTYGTVQAEWDTNAKTVQDILDGVHGAIGSVKGSVGDLRENVRSSLKEQG